MRTITNNQIPSIKRSSTSKSSITKHAFDLEERTLTFAKGVLHLCQAVKLDVLNRDIISQVIRASSSVGANYREANDTASKKDFAHRIRITLREAKEAHYWLQLLEETSSVANGRLIPLLDEALELRKIFSTIAQKVS